MAGRDVREPRAGRPRRTRRPRRSGPRGSGGGRDRARRDRAAAGDPRRAGDRAGPSRRGGGPRAGDPATCSTDPPTRSRAASSSAWPSPPRWWAARELILLDEPTSQLDPVAGDELIGLLRRLNEEWGTTIVLAEHRLERCLAAADRVVAMADGTVAFDGAPAPFLEWALSADPALATPGAHALRPRWPAPARAERQARPPAPRPRGGQARGAVADRGKRRGRRLRRAVQAGALRARPRGFRPVGGTRRRDRHARRPAWPGLPRRGRRAGGADGSQRCRQEHAAARGRRTARTGSREGRGAAGLRAAHPEPVRLPHPRAGGRGAARRRRRGRPAGGGAGGARRARPARPLGRGAPAPGAGDRDGGPGREGGRASSASTSRPVAWTARARTSSSSRLGELAPAGSAVLVATHDVEFAARFAERVVLLGEGSVIADGAGDEVLAGGWYFATEVARILGAGGTRSRPRPERSSAQRLGSDRGAPVTWQATSLRCFIGLVIVGGFGWYERSRPSSRMVALVAGLAALAVAGRLVLAPVPNVVATTDVALHHRLRARRRPGFAVGALAAPVSNLWLGQGPWTPWQMAGWGLCGTRWALASPWSAGSAAGPSWPRLRVRVRGVRLRGPARPVGDGHLRGRAVARPLPGSVGAGHAFQHRPRSRELRDRARGRTGAGADDLALSRAAGVHVDLGRGAGAGRCRRGAGARRLAARPGLGPGRAAGRPRPAEAASGARGREGLARARAEPDGGFGATPAAVVQRRHDRWAMLGLEAAGATRSTSDADGNSPVDSCAAAPSGSSSTADLERTILALAGAGISPRSFEGRDLVAELRAKRDGDGSFDGNVNCTAFGGLRAARSVSGPASELRALGDVAARAPELATEAGGSAAARRAMPDSTGAALQALDAAGGGGPPPRTGSATCAERSSATAACRSRRRRLNSQSTAWAVQGLVAAGVAPASVRLAGAVRLDYLAARQARTATTATRRRPIRRPSGSPRQALMAVEPAAFPLGRGARRSASRAPCRAPAEPSGAGGGQGASGRRLGRRAAAAGPDGGNGGGPSTAGKARCREGRCRERPAPTGRPRRSSPRPTFRPEPGRRAAAGSSNDATPCVLAGLGALALALARRLPLVPAPGFRSRQYAAMDVDEAIRRPPHAQGVPARAGAARDPRRALRARPLGARTTTSPTPGAFGCWGRRRSSG